MDTFRIHVLLKPIKCVQCSSDNTVFSYEVLYTYILANQNNTKVRKRAKIRNRYNHSPHLTQDTNGKVTTSQLDIINESKEVSRFRAGDHKALIYRRTKALQKEDRNNINDPQKSTALER